MSSPRRALLIACAAAGEIVVAAALLSCGAQAKPQADAPPASLSAPPPSVQLAQEKPVLRAPREELTGSLVPAKALQLGFEVAGRLSRIEVRKGASVAQGQVIARLDPEIADAQVAQAAAAALAARAQAQLAADVARRNQELQASGSVSDLQIKSSSASAAAAAAQLAAAEAQLAQARALRRRHDLRAPFAGVLIDAPDQVGATVTSGKELFTLEQLDPLVLKITVAEIERKSLRPGARVHVEAIGGNAATDDALVRTIIPSADAATRRVPVEITVPNPRGLFTAHTLGRATLLLGEAENAVALPSSALASDGGADHVFSVGQHGEVRRIPVQVLDRGAREVVVRAQQQLTRVIDYPSSDLADGAQVVVR